MQRFVLHLCGVVTCLLSCSHGRPRSARAAAGAPVFERSTIQDGYIPPSDRFPYAAALLDPDKNGAFLCAGSLVHPRIVITAAHCVVKVEGSSMNKDPHVQLGLLGGSEGRDANRAAGLGMGLLLQSMFGPPGGSQAHVKPTQTFFSRSFVHPKYDPPRSGFDYDIALLILSEASDQHPISFMHSQSDASSLKGNLRDAGNDGELIALGWGATEANVLSGVLLATEVSSIAGELCQNSFRRYASIITSRMACVSGRTCAGDSGGPIISANSNKQDDAQPGIATDTLVGLVSFGFPRRKGQACPDPGSITVVTKVEAPGIYDFVNHAVDLLNNVYFSTSLKDFNESDFYTF